MKSSSTKTVLISGAGVAGSTLAWWFARNGFAPTVVEKAGEVRSSGAPVDVTGDALDAVKAMGLVDPLRARATQVRAVHFIDAHGGDAARVEMATFSGSAESIELPRGDLAHTLYEASKHDADYIFGDQVASLVDTTGGVDVRFESGRQQRFDWVIGADGLHSQVRKLVFGPESDFVEHAGLYVATMPLPDERPHPGKVLVYNTPGRAISIHPGRDKALCAFIFYSPQVPHFDPHNKAQHQAMLRAAFADQGWRSEELIEQACRSSDLYVDSVSRVIINPWSRGRVALVGDAASCLSLFGGGSSLAIAGARILATEMAAAEDCSTAFARYEQQHRRTVEPRLRNMGLAASQVVPKTAVGIVARNAAMKIVPLVVKVSQTMRKR